MDGDRRSHRCLSAEVVVDDSGERIRGTGNITRSQITVTTQTHNASRFRLTEKQMMHEYNIYARFLEEEKQSVTEQVIFVIMLVYQKAGSGPHRASMTWQCRLVLWASLCSSRDKWISPWTSSSGSTRVRFSQLSKPAGKHTYNRAETSLISTDYKTLIGCVQYSMHIIHTIFFFCSIQYLYCKPYTGLMFAFAKVCSIQPECTADTVSHNAMRCKPFISRVANIK